MREERGEGESEGGREVVQDELGWVGSWFRVALCMIAVSEM